MEAQVLLCDFANVTEGKLNIIGGGWSVVTASGPAIKMAVAVRINTSWTETNTPHEFKLTLINQDGQPVLGPRGNPMVSAGGKFEVGRPAGMVQGEDLPNCLAFDFPPLGPIAPGLYAFQIHIDTQLVGRAPFRVQQQLGGMMP